MLSLSVVQIFVVVISLGLVFFYAVKKFNPRIALLSGVALLLVSVVYVLILGGLGSDCSISEAVRLQRIACSPAIFGVGYSLVIYGVSAIFIRCVGRVLRRN